jgi:outer membrane protein insertion porin family
LAIELQVEEGLQSTVSTLRIVGNQSIPQNDFPEIYTTPGQPFSESNISTDREIVLNFYFNHGFPDAGFEASAKPATEPNHIDVTFTIHEGRQEFVDRVLVSGLNYTKPFVVQRELQINSGDPLSQIKMLNTQRSLYDLGIFSQVDTAVQNPASAESHKNILVRVQEANRYTFTYGLGLEFQTGQPQIGANQPQGATGVSPRISFEVTRLNFRGRNQTLTFKTDVGRLQQRALVSADIPRYWFNSKNLKFSITGLYDNTIQVSTFTSQRLEGAIQAAQTVNRTSTLVYSFTYRRVRSSNIELDPAQVPLLSFPVLVAMPSISYVRNTRDNDLESTKGTYTSIEAGVAASYFGSEADFSRTLVQNSSYYAFGKNQPGERKNTKYVFARSTRIGIENAFGNTFSPQPGENCPQSQQPLCLPLPERFYSGGGNSHRGFGLNQAGPRDPETGFPLGGSALLLNSMELRFPPMSLPFFHDNLSFAVFHDAGNVFSDGNDLLNSLSRWKQRHPEFCEQASTASQCDYKYISQAVGLGIRYKTPIGPVRFDLGYNLNPPKFPSFQTVSDPNNPGQQIQQFIPQQARHFNIFFSIGQTF